MKIAVGLGLILVVVICNVSAEFSERGSSERRGVYRRSSERGSQEKGKKEGGNYGGNYGGGGGHYAIGFNTEEINKICGSDQECTDCFTNSQSIDENDKRTVKLADSINCVREHLPNSPWGAACINYGNQVISDGRTANENELRLYSFCMRTDTEFYLAQRCDSAKSWRDFMTCFSAEGAGGKKAGGKTERGSHESGSNEK